MSQKEEIGKLLLHGARIWGSNGKYARLFEDGTLCEITLFNDRYRIALSKDKRKASIKYEYPFEDSAKNTSRILSMPCSSMQRNGLKEMQKMTTPISSVLSDSL